MLPHSQVASIPKAAKRVTQRKRSSPKAELLQQGLPHQSLYHHYHWYCCWLNCSRCTLLLLAPFKKGHTSSVGLQWSHTAAIPSIYSTLFRCQQIQWAVNGQMQLCFLEQNCLELLQGRTRRGGLLLTVRCLFQNKGTSKMQAEQLTLIKYFI